MPGGGYVLGVGGNRSGFVIGKDLHREGRAVEIVAPGFQGMDDCEEFAVVDVVISLGRGE